MSRAVKPEAALGSWGCDPESMRAWPKVDNHYHHHHHHHEDGTLVACMFEWNFVPSHNITQLTGVGLDSLP